MSQQSVLYQWTEEIRKNMQHLSKPQTKALAAFSAGIAKAEGCGLNAASKKLPFAGNPANVERRIQRFIASDRIDNAESCRATAKWVIGSLPEYKPVVLPVDETGLKDRLKWERSRVWNPDRANRLWLAMALAYAWLASLGAAAFGSDKAVKEAAGVRSRAARSALFRLGADVFRLCLELGRGGVCSPLFPSGLGRAGKSVARQALYGRRLG